MTAYEVVGALVRRWWVVVIGLVATAGAVLAVAGTQATYWTSYDLNLVAPDRSGEVYSRISAPSGVIPVAGIVEVMLGGNHAEPRSATQTVPIFALDHQRSGYSVRAKDKGLQWSRDYVAALTIQINEPTREEVLAQAEVLSRRAHAALDQLQDENQVPDRARLTLEDPRVIDVAEIAPSHVRAAAGASVLGTAATLVLAVWTDRLQLRRRSRPRGASASLVPARNA